LGFLLLTLNLRASPSERIGVARHLHEFIDCCLSLFFLFRLNGVSDDHKARAGHKAEQAKSDKYA